MKTLIKVTLFVLALELILAVAIAYGLFWLIRAALRWWLRRRRARRLVAHAAPPDLTRFLSAEDRAWLLRHQRLADAAYAELTELTELGRVSEQFTPHSVREAG